MAAPRTTRHALGEFFTKGERRVNLETGTRFTAVGSRRVVTALLLPGGGSGVGGGVGRSPSKLCPVFCRDEHPVLEHRRDFP